jgi:dUTP pyrophosphatase
LGSKILGPLPELEKKEGDDMKIKIKRVDKSLPLPEYKTEGAAAFDLYVRETVIIPAHSVKLIPMNTIIELPKGCWAMLVPRSSCHKKGIMAANGIGIGDLDYCGENDEYHFPALNFTDSEVVIERGDRIAQMMIFHYDRAEFTEVDSFSHNVSRGGFGSTGDK